MIFDSRSLISAADSLERNIERIFYRTDVLILRWMFVWDSTYVLEKIDEEGVPRPVIWFCVCMGVPLRMNINFIFHNANIVILIILTTSDLFIMSYGLYVPIV